MLSKRLQSIKKSPYAPGVAFVLVFALVSFALIYTRAPRPGVPTFSKGYATTLSDYSGKPVNFESYRGTSLIVYFWATWCPYCSAEIEHLAQIKEHYGNRIQILAVNRGESLGDAKDFSDKLGVSGIEFLLDQNDGLFKQLQGYAMPETIFINARGEVVLHQRGPMDAQAADAAAAALFQ